MKLREVVDPEKLRALRAMGQSVDNDRRRVAMGEEKKRREEEKKRKQEDARLAHSLGVKPGIMSHEELLTLAELREGGRGPRLSRSIAKSHSPHKRISWRIASSGTAQR